MVNAFSKVPRGRDVDQIFQELDSLSTRMILLADSGMSNRISRSKYLMLPGVMKSITIECPKNLKGMQPDDEHRTRCALRDGLGNAPEQSSLESRASYGADDEETRFHI